MKLHIQVMTEMITFSSKGQIKKNPNHKSVLEYSFGIWQGPLNLIEYFERQSSNMPVCFEIGALTDIDKAQVWCIWCVLQYLTSQWYFDLVNPVWFPEVFSISSPFLKRKKKHTHIYILYLQNFISLCCKQWHPDILIHNFYCACMCICECMCV